MAVLVERRECPRFKIPGAKVVFYQEERFQDSKVVSEEGLMDDCSSKGVRFQTEKELQPGAKGKLELVIPGEDIIAIIGNIIWTLNSPEKNKSSAVFEFAPYGEYKGYNPISVKNDLEKMAAKYLTIKE